jgi:hypothetical protein
VDWTEEEFRGVGRDMVANFDVAIMDEGIFSLVHIRAIVLVPPVVEPTKEQLEEESQLSEYGHYDPDTIAWLKANGVDVSKGGYNG